MYHPPYYVLAFQQNAGSTSSTCVLCEGSVIDYSCAVIIMLSVAKQQRLLPSL